MNYVAYYGNPLSKLWGRVVWKSKESALIGVWNHSYYYDLHEESEPSYYDELWERTREEAKGSDREKKARESVGRCSRNHLLDVREQ